MENNDSVITLKNGNTISLTWDSKVLKNHFDKDFAEVTNNPLQIDLIFPLKKIKMDASMNETKKETPSRTLTLEDCMHLFVQDEKLGPNDTWFCPKCKEFHQGKSHFFKTKKKKTFTQSIQHFLSQQKIRSLETTSNFGYSFEEILTTTKNFDADLLSVGRLKYGKFFNQS